MYQLGTLAFPLYLPLGLRFPKTRNFRAISLCGAGGEAIHLSSVRRVHGVN